MTKEQLKIIEKHAEALKAEGILSGSSKYINPIRKLKDKPKATKTKPTPQIANISQ